MPRNLMISSGVLFSLTMVLSNCSSSKYEDVGYYKDYYFRIFSVYVDDHNWEAMHKYDKSKPYTETKHTIVYFFDNRENTPDVTLIGEDFPKRYEDYCVAKYWKRPNGKESFEKYPFKAGE